MAEPWTTEEVRRAVDRRAEELWPELLEAARAGGYGRLVRENEEFIRSALRIGIADGMAFAAKMLLERSP